MIDKKIISQLLEKKLDGTDYFLVDVKVTLDNNIIVEVDNNEGVDIEFCANLSRYIESNLDRETEDFSLEIGSAGLTQPFKVLKQYSKNIGNEVEVLTKTGKKLKGILKQADESGFTIEIEKQVKPEGSKRKITIQEDEQFTYEEIKYTKYIIRFK